MGLAVAQGIVSNHGGTITVASQEGKGATFQILLPVHCRENAAPPGRCEGNCPRARVTSCWWTMKPP